MTPEEEVTVVETTPAPAGVTLEQMEHHKASIRREMEEIVTNSKREHEELTNAQKDEIAHLKDELEKMNAWKKEVEERNANEEAGKESDTTIVAPPSHLAPTQPSPTAPIDPQHAGEHPEKKRRKWKDIY